MVRPRGASSSLRTVVFLPSSFLLLGCAPTNRNTPSFCWIAPCLQTAAAIDWVPGKKSYEITCLSKNGMVVAGKYYAKGGVGEQASENDGQCVLISLARAFS